MNYTIYIKEKNLAPNGRAATQEVPRDIPGSSVRAVWLQQTVILQMG